MAADDLDAPLGQNKPPKRPSKWPTALMQGVAALLGSVVVGFMLWTAFVSDPLGGEPVALTRAEPPPPIDKPNPAGPSVADKPATPAIQRYEDPAARTGTQTITIIDGSSGKKQEVVIPGSSANPAPPADPRLLEESRHGMIPRIATDGTRVADAYAVPAANTTGLRIALIIGGLGVSANGTADALAKLPGAVTLGFLPYGNETENFVSRARAEGHEVLLQVPMEPYDYPDNDPGPQTLLTSLSSDQNIDRLHWLLSRFQGYVGIQNFMGARFTATEAALGPVLRETAKRGLIYVDDGTSARSISGQIAGANKIPFAKAELVIDAVPTQNEIDKALSRLEDVARSRGFAVGTGSALPATVERIAKWAKSAAGRGITLVPISAVAIKPKSS